MKKLLILAALPAITLTAWSQQTLGDYPWGSLAKQGLLHSPAAAVTLDGRDAVKIENTNDAPLQVNLLTIEQPAVTAQLYELTGEIRYDSVQGDGFLELWNYFPPLEPGLPEGQYFSRTLGKYGPMGKISGTSAWRKFTLPFDRTGASGSPTRLQVNLFLAGRGTVYVGSLKLVQLGNVKLSAAAHYPNAWWSDRTGGLVGGWGGSIIGGLGALIGVLAAMGKARRFIMAVLVLLTGFGLALLTAGLVAVAEHQPYAVWYPLTLGGILLATICPGNLWLFFRINQEAELRRMQALDVSGA